MIWFKNIVLAATMLALCVVVFGAYVRLTDAGLGCPDWPGCYGTLTVPESVAAIEKAQANYPESKIDNKKAVEYYTRSADLGNSDAQINLGYMYIAGQGLKKDLQKAAHYINKAKMLQHPKAQTLWDEFNLADFKGDK